MNWAGLCWFTLVALSYPKDENRRLAPNAAGVQRARILQSASVATISGVSQEWQPWWASEPWREEYGRPVILEGRPWWAIKSWGEDHGESLSPGIKTMVGHWALGWRSCGLLNFIKSYFAHPHDAMITVSCFFFINFVWPFHTDMCIIITISPILSSYLPLIPTSSFLWKKLDVIQR